ncbi:unnamed protein product [Linum tenue]|uniref:Cytochrome P450 n=1 Tax=Linum tenue TaxID=586396 RepID=A0AAV0H1M1_9ROSI|nr:unnamed protein product [Linum tenue]
MEFPNFDIIALLASLFLLSFAAAKRFTTTKSSILTNLPVGPATLPLLGNVHNLIFYSSKLHRALHRLALNHGPLFPLKLGQITILVVSSPELAKEILKDHDITFAQRAPLLFPALIFYDCTDVLFAPYGDYWRQVRKICQMELLSPNRVKSFASIRSQEVSNLIESVRSSSSSPVNLTRLIFQMSCGVTSRSAFGRKYKDHETLMSLAMDIMKLTSGLGLADLFPSHGEMLKAMTRMFSPKLNGVTRVADRVLEDVLSDHRKKRSSGLLDDGNRVREDLVDVLLNLQKSGDLQVPLSDNNIKAVLLDMLVAGSMTSSATVGWIMSEIVKNPSAMKRAQDEVRRIFDTKGQDVDEETAIQDLPFLKCCIKEAIRLHPPVALIVRESRTSCNISGYDIPSNTIVSINAWTICRDPRYWSGAERFVPERFLCGNNTVNYVEPDHFEFTPFGAGRRRCPGVSFAMANIELPVAKLLYHFDWELPDGKRNQELDMAENFGVTVRRKNDLVLVPIPHHPTFAK